MKNLSLETKLIFGLAILVIGYIVLRGWAGAAKDVVVGATNAAAGAVEGVGLAVGIPTTSTDPCEAACAAGDGWHASLYCPASRFLTYLRDGK